MTLYVIMTRSLGLERFGNDDDDDRSTAMYRSLPLGARRRRPLAHNRPRNGAGAHIGLGARPLLGHNAFDTGGASRAGERWSDNLLSYLCREAIFLN